MNRCVSGWTQDISASAYRVLSITVLSMTATIVTIAQPAIAQFQDSESGSPEQSEQTAQPKQTTQVNQSPQLKRVHLTLSQFEPNPDTPNPTTGVPDTQSQWLLAQFASPQAPIPLQSHFHS